MFNIFKKQVDTAIYYKEVFDTPAGKRVLYDLVVKGNVLNNTFDPDPYVTAFNNGKRDTVLQIVRMLNIDIDELIKRQEEGHLHDQRYIEQ